MGKRGKGGVGGCMAGFVDVWCDWETKKESKLFFIIFALPMKLLLCFSLSNPLKSPTSTFIGVVRLLSRKQHLGMRVGIVALGMDSLFQLHHLQRINFAFNKFSSSSIPSDIGCLRNLRHLNLSNSYFDVHGYYRNQFARCSDRELLLLSNLERLKLGSNFLLKGNLPKIRPSNTLLELNISYKGISSEQPDSIGTLSSLIPNSIGNLTQIRKLDLGYNHFTGQIPSSIGNLTQLRELYLHGNHFSGEIPNSIGNLTQIRELDLGSVTFFYLESVPHCLGSMVGLGDLDLRKNNFSRSLPPLYRQSTSLTNIVLNGNHFEGPLPVSSLNCIGLEVLDMGNNAIDDTFPAWLGTLEELQVLILKSNTFHGPISTRQKFCFPKLLIFDLSHNEFSGSLPSGVFRNFKAMTKCNTT
ncbi:receptor-like protein 43 [Lycium barbarum]|uniref:receptor-like protein 43 n=1 Tax=Lycium barbarum TaxID=112863 RepID=UPI00293E22CA|nr:receptor-like protein 43 [Lycium barbarum]